MRCNICDYEMTFSDRLLHRTATGYYCPACWAVISEDESAPKAPTTAPGPEGQFQSPLVELTSPSVLAETKQRVPARQAGRPSPPTA